MTRLAVVRLCVKKGVRVSCVVGLLVLAGCERGCLWRLIPRAGIAGAQAGAGSDQPSQAWFGMGEVDCPDGLARCSGGVVQRSLVARRPSPCRGNPESCACPWTLVDRCEGECVADGLEIATPADRAVSQLCVATPGSSPFARPTESPEGHGDPGTASRDASARSSPPVALAAFASACEGEAFVCLASSVVACGKSPAVPLSLVGTCTSGCALDAALGGAVAERLQAPQALALLCAR